MINSLMSRMNAANNLSVQQLHQAVADGTLPAYVGVPMIQDKMKQQQQAMAMQQPQQQPPIADQIMAASAPRRMPRRMPQEQQVASEVAQAPAPEDTQGIEAAQSNLPTQMAQGGILGFAAGGMDDEDEDRELSQLYGSGTDNDIIQAIAAGDGGSGIHPSAAIQMRPESEGIGFGKGHKYHDAVIEEAKRQKLDPNIALHALYKETGGMKDPENARSKSGAIGVMQLMPATAKALGIDPTDPYQNIQGGVTYLKQMQDKFGDSHLALMAYNAGPGRVERALHSPQGLASLPAETRNYNEGGIAHFAGPSGSLVGLGGRSSGSSDDSDDSSSDTSTSYQRPGRGKAMSLSDIANSISPAHSQRTAAARPPVSGYQGQIADMDVPTPGANIAGTTAAAPAPAPVVDASTNPTPPVTPPQASGGISGFQDPMVAKMLANIAESRAEAKKDKETNKYLALMQAGFGMMGGTSPYASVNIGKGAEQGVGTYATLNQASSKEANDLQNQELALYKYGSAAENAKLNREALLSQYQGKMGEKQYEFETKQQDRNIALANAFENSSIKALDARYSKNALYNAGDPKTVAQYNAEKSKIYSDPRYVSLNKKAYGDAYVAPDEASTGSNLPATVTRDGKTYVLQSNGKYVEKQ